MDGEGEAIIVGEEYKLVWSVGVAKLDTYVLTKSRLE